MDQALATYGRLDAAFNNATDGPQPAPLAEIDPDEFDRGIATNVRGTFLGMKFQIAAMLEHGGGAIVNMASMAGSLLTFHMPGPEVSLDNPESLKIPFGVGVAITVTACAVSVLWRPL